MVRPSPRRPPFARQNPDAPARVAAPLRPRGAAPAPARRSCKRRSCATATASARLAKRLCNSAAHPAASRPLSPPAGLDCCNICYCQQRRQIVKEQKERAKHAGTEAVYTCPPPAAPAASASGAPPRPACAPRASKEAAKSLFRGGLVRGLESSSCSSGEHYSPRSSALQRPSAIRFGSVDGSKSISESVSLPEPRQLSPRHAPPVRDPPLLLPPSCVRRFCCAPRRCSRQYA